MVAKIQMNRIQCNANNRVRISLLASVLRFPDLISARKYQLYIIKGLTNTGSKNLLFEPALY